MEHDQDKTSPLTSNDKLKELLRAVLTRVQNVEVELAKVETMYKEADINQNLIVQEMRLKLTGIIGELERIASVYSPETQQHVTELRTRMEYVLKALELQGSCRKTFEDLNIHNIGVVNELNTIRTDIADIHTRLDDNDSKTTELFSYRTTMIHIGQTLLGLGAIAGTIWTIYGAFE